MKYIVLRLIAALEIILFLMACSGIPSVHAKSEILQWNQLTTPGFDVKRNDIVKSSEVNCFCISRDGNVMYSVNRAAPVSSTGEKALYKSTDKGIIWKDDPGKRLYESMSAAEKLNFHIWNISICPDNSNIIAAVTNSLAAAPEGVWISLDGGSNWNNTRISSASPISTIDIASDGVNFYIAAGTRSGTGTGLLYIFKMNGTGPWKVQPVTGDFMALKWSPNFKYDYTLTAVYTNNNGTYFNIGVFDAPSNLSNWNTIYGDNAPEITASGDSTSVKVVQMIGASLDLPQDFSGQAPGQRRAFISIDSTSVNSGIFRIDDFVVYWLMTATTLKRIASISYFGTYSSGKLLAGEVLGETSKAAAMTWFTDAPNTCPVTCWYQAVKPATGAAGTTSCGGLGYCNTQVSWSPDGNTAFAATSSTSVLTSGINWYLPYLTGKNYDESAFSRSNNNGESWNQISLIDTKIDYFSDIAPSARGNVIYLASSNNNTGCAGFDSVWKSSGTALNTSWERVLCKPTISENTSVQRNSAILQISGDSPDGQYLCYSATGSTYIYWSPDYGDYWITINALSGVQDIAPEDRNTLYTLDSRGIVQKMAFSGKSWYPISIANTGIESAYSIASAYTSYTPDNARGNIIVGGSGTGLSDAAYSTDGGRTFTAIPKLLPGRGNTVVIASASFSSDGSIIAINASGMYTYCIYSGTDTDWGESWGGRAYPSPVTSVALSRNSGYYFNTPGSTKTPAKPYVRWAAATSGLDKTVKLGSSDYPNRKIKISGGLENNEPVTLFTIDQRDYSLPVGGVWFYTDTLAWTGPVPTSPVSRTPVAFDTVSGRNGQIHITWKPLSLSRGYRVQIAKDGDFYQLIADIGGKSGGPYYSPANVDQPAIVVPPGGGEIKDNNANIWNIPSMESGHTYYWRIKVQDVFTGDSITSPWSWKESFTISNGFKVVSPCYGLQLLQPAPESCVICSPQPSFSWTIYPDTTSYQFQLADDAEFKAPIVSRESTVNAYQLSSSLNNNTTYFWRVRAVSPYPSDWSMIGAFTVKEAEISPLSDPIYSTPVWVWAVISLGALFAVIVLMLIILRNR
jgi:hypothetical protein